MVSVNPFGDFRDECKKALKEALEESGLDFSPAALTLDVPPSAEFGELASTFFFELGKRTGKQPAKLAKRTADLIKVTGFPLIDRVRVAGNGFVNFYANFPRLAQATINSARTLDKKYGHVKADTPQRIIVEHTSANPISPIHVGQGRNPVLGDALANILKARGHKVQRHFYVDDVGRQTAVVGYGYKKLGKPALEGKPDHAMGQIYAITNCIIEIERLKRAREREPERRQEVTRHLDDWVGVAAELEKKSPDLFNQLTTETRTDHNISDIVRGLNRDYEAGKTEAKKLIREVCEISLKGIRATLANMDISLDSWDWESDFAWSGATSRVLDALRDSGYAFQEGPVWEFAGNRVAEDLQLKEKLGLKGEYEIPSLTLTRADGTTLYTTRDIPYTLWKFEKADRVINVVGMEQKLSQLQLKLALWALKHVDQAENLTHFAYNLVSLPGYRMSGRRGRFISLDQVMEEAVIRARKEVEERSPQLPEEEKRQISQIIGMGALKYALVQVDPMKPVVFTWDRVLNFEQNSAPYIQYTYARARSIVRKASRKTFKPDYLLLVEALERELLLKLARFPEVFVNSAENLKPNTIADYVNALADRFNSFYNLYPVIKATPDALSDARLLLVEAVSIVVRNSLSLIGIVAPEKM